MGGFQIKDGTVAFRTESNQGFYLALKDINLTISFGEFIAVVGPNGSGKSTLAKVISGLLPLSKGKLEWSRLDASARRDTSTALNTETPLNTRTPLVQMVFQNPDAQILGETVYEDVCFGLENFGVPASEMPDQVQHALHQVGFNADMNMPVGSLSGGQKQLLCVASCLAVGANVLVFDEATAMLNPAARMRILQLAQELQATGMTIIWVTQWMEEAAQARRVIALESGEIRFDGGPREFFYGKTGVMQSAPCEALNMTPPYAVQVVQSLMGKGIVLPTLPLTIQELSKGVQQLCPSL